MRNIKIILEYDGTDFAGWQIQPEERTVQGELTRVLKRVTKENITVTGAGRTDRGVHALGQVANFATESSMKPFEFVRALNSLLPPDLLTKDTKEVEADFSARYSAVQRHYVYKLRRKWTVFNRRYVYVPPHFPEINAMNDAAPHLTGSRDFAALGNASDDYDSTVREVTRVAIEEAEDGVDVFVSANAFVYRMVRNMVSLIINVGVGEIAPGDVAAIIEGMDRSVLGPPAPASGLYLIGVDYK
ncbi:MAG: tRNA pseudouridine(38-40) synthase TruA [bacterium]|nr:tRNA pseudouridine(38-40) synthase TruA [bacterium]